VHLFIIKTTVAFSSPTEFWRDQISPHPFPNSEGPLGDRFQRLQEGGFQEWRLAVDGMVARPTVFSVQPPRHRGNLLSGALAGQLTNEHFHGPAEWLEGLSNAAGPFSKNSFCQR
jgi:hypothetical protein